MAGLTIKQALAKVKENKNLMQRIDNAMTNEVFRKVQAEEAAAIYDTVYKVYNPEVYRRRGEYGGMADPYNIEIRGGAAQDGVMVVVNTTEPNPGGCLNNHSVTTGKNLPALVEYGDGYHSYHYDFPSDDGRYMKPRPFTAKTIENLQKSKAHIAAMKVGLKRRGVKVR